MSTLMSGAMMRLMAELRHEPTAKRIRALAGDRVVVDSTEAVLVYEPRRVSPMLAVPETAVAGELTSNGPAKRARPGFLHPGIRFVEHSTPGESLSVTVDGQVFADAAFRADDPDLAGLLVLDFHAFDWLEEDEPIHGHPRNPYHAVDIRQSSRHLRIVHEGQLLVDSKRPTLLFETSLPTRYYVPREDVVAELRPSDQISYCPYKGEAVYWSVEGRDNAAWSYERPLRDAEQITGLVAFWDDVFEVTLDGVPMSRGETPSAKALRKEFKV